MVRSGILFGFFFVYPLLDKLRWTVRVHTLTSRLSCNSLLRSLVLYSRCARAVCVSDARFELLFLLGLPLSLSHLSVLPFLSFARFLFSVFSFIPVLLSNSLTSVSPEWKRTVSVSFGVFTRRHGDVIESWVAFGVYFHAIELAGENAMCCYSLYQ